MHAAVDLFEWAYKRSVQNYKFVREAMREPDPFRTRLREALNAAVQAVVAKGKAVPAAVEELRLDLEDRSRNRNPRNRLKPKR